MTDGTPLWEAQAKNAQPVGPIPGYRYANLVERVAATFLDYIVFAVVAAPAYILLDPRIYSPIRTVWVLVAFVGVFAFAIRPLGGRTVAGRLLGLRIVRRSDGAAIGDGRAIVRLVGLFLTLILWPVSLIVTLVGRERRTPADALAGTVVIKRTKAPTDALSS
jgi:uncharacterized RDD family membrane protein YckC